MIVCLEGIDGCGKSTHANLLGMLLGCDVMHFPDYETPTGRVLHGHLRSRWAARFSDPEEDQLIGHHVDAMTFQSLMLTNRMEHAPTIHSARIHNESLVIDRYWPSGVVYGGADHLDYDWLLRIHQYLPQAHDYVLIDIDPSDSTGRRPQRRDRYEQQPGLMDEVASRYRELWNEMNRIHSSNWHLIDGRASVDEVYRALCETLCLDSDSIGTTSQEDRDE